MLNRNSQIIQTNRRAFTLVELLLVIGIIALLIGLLVPTVAKVRIAGQKVATQGLLNRISAACEAYYQDYNAYPGPFTDAQMTSWDVPPGTPAPTINSYTLRIGLGGAPIAHMPTSSENLFLGLCGGLRYNPSPSAAADERFVYDEETAKRSLGPSGLGDVSKRPRAYLELTPGDISSTDDTANPLNTPGTTPGLWWPGGSNAANAFRGDSQIFEFVDTFRVRRPVLYLRANRGVSRSGTIENKNLKGFIRVPTDTSIDTDPYQYDPTQIQYAYSNMRDKAGTDAVNQIWAANDDDYPAVLDGAKTKFRKGNERYFVNEKLSTGNSSTMAEADKVLIPQQRDKFILISAGPDGIYGTADDIRN